jgi:hypothetical protein
MIQKVKKGHAGFARGRGSGQAAVEDELEAALVAVGIPDGPL